MLHKQKRQDSVQKIVLVLLIFNSPKGILDVSIQLLIKILKLQPRAGDLEGIILELALDVPFFHDLLLLTEEGIRRQTFELNGLYGILLSLIKYQLNLGSEILSVNRRRSVPHPITSPMQLDPTLRQHSCPGK